MRMTDIIKAGTRGNTARERFRHRPRRESDKDYSMQMRKVKSSDYSFAGEDRDIEELYQKVFTEMRRLFNRAVISFDILPPPGLIKALAVEIAGRLQLGQVDIMDIFMRPLPEDDNYLAGHTVNVTFLAVIMGVWLNYNKSQLYQLAAAAIFHDIGMVSVLDIARLPRRLKPEEMQQVGRHPLYSKEFTSQIKGMDEGIIDAVFNHHRRVDDRPPRRPSDYSQIIGLADTFEAMTHPRTYKDAEEPHSAMRNIIEDLRAGFAPKIIKALVDNIGIYPAGTLVRLDTGETGVVIDVNHGFPLSPKVNILFDKDLMKLSQPRTVDLSRQASIHIDKPLDEESRRTVKERLLG